jgi:PadR family transcriptional regulator AphA
VEFSINHQKQLEILCMFEKELLSIKDIHSNHGDVLRVIDFGQKVYKAYIDWCNETIIYIESRAQNA